MGSLIPCNQAICVPPVAAELVVYFHCGYARKMAVEPLKLKQLFFLCSIATRCSALCVPDRPIAPLLLQLLEQIEGYHQRSVGPVKMLCYRQGQNHISVLPHFVSKLTFPLQYTRAQHTSLSHSGVEQVGLLLNADKTVVLTNEAQPPPILATDGGLKLAILQRNVGQKWLGCMLAAEGSQSQHIDLEYHLQQASKFFYANRWILLGRSVSISKRLKYFNAVVSSVACFGSGHRAIYNSQLAALDVHFRKLCRSIVGPPSEVDWNAAWNEILHLWNERTRSFVANARVNT